jgi:hypothetical protein
MFYCSRKLSWPFKHEQKSKNTFLCRVKKSHITLFKEEWSRVVTNNLLSLSWYKRQDIFIMFFYTMTIFKSARDRPGIRLCSDQSPDIRDRIRIKSYRYFDTFVLV